MRPRRGSEEVLATELPTEAAGRQVAQRAYSKARKSKEEAPKAKEEAPKAPKAKEEAPKAKEEAPKAKEEAPKAPKEEAPKASEEILEVDDGCVCGMASGIRWVADRNGVVEFMKPVTPDMEARVRAEVNAHYARRPRRGRPPKPETEAAKAPAPKPRGRPPKPKAEAAEAPAPKPRGRPPEAAAAPAPKPRGRPPKPKAEAAEAPAPKPRGRPPKPKADAAEAPAPKPRGRPPKPKEAPKPRGRPPKPKAEEAPSKSNNNGNGNGNLQWRSVGENSRAPVANGYFEIVPEGAEYALYFADINSVTTWITSGVKDTLIQVANERNSRGMGAAPAAASTNLDELFAQAIRSG